MMDSNSNESDPDRDQFDAGHYDPDDESDEEPVSAELNGLYKRVAALRQRLANDAVDRETRVSSMSSFYRRTVTIGPSR